jgi:predicted class III extradiol MEMO1 family dioxygenase
MHCNGVAAELLQPTEVSKMRPERSLHISVMRTKRIIIFVPTHTHTHTSYRKGERYQDCSTNFGAIDCDILQNTVFLRT